MSLYVLRVYMGACTRTCVYELGRLLVASLILCIKGIWHTQAKELGKQHAT